jgi:hypothetical protein
MKSMRFLAPVAAACLVVTQPAPALAWGWQGHEYVGALAWQLLNPNARSHVRQLLGSGVSLSLGAVWADCAKSVKGPPEFKLTTRFTAQVCFDFSKAERQRMYDYVQRNWNNCRYSHRLADCHKSYHFADVNVHDHSDYDVAYFGAGPNDVVQAIKATTIALKCGTWTTCAIPQPFNFANKREALLLLAHFVGDLHQPLHVGAVYLDNNGQETGDSGAEAIGVEAETIGGNALFVSPGGENLHHVWDTVPDAPPSAEAIAQACLISPLPSPTPQPPEAWASESVAAAREAYNGMTFVADQPADGWDIQFANKAAYMTDAKRVQAIQRIKAGARLATILNSVWPSTKVAAACD